MIFFLLSFFIFFFFLILIIIIIINLIIILKVMKLFRDLDGHVFGRIHADFKEEDVVFDKVALLEHLVGHEAREAEAQGVRLPRRPLEVLPRRIRNETLHDVARLIGIGRLVVQRETDRVGERPFEEGIIFTGEDFDVNRHVRSFTRSVAIEEQRSLQLVAVLAGVERSADQLESFLDGGFVDLDADVVDAPQESARVVGRDARYGRAQCRQLLLLPKSQHKQQQQKFISFRSPPLTLHSTHRLASPHIKSKCCRCASSWCFSSE